MFKYIAASFIILSLAPLATAQTQPPIEAYGELPEIRYAAISDSGGKVALVQYSGEKSGIVIYDLETDTSTGVGASKVKVRGVDFIGDEYVIINASDTTRTYGYRGEYEFSAAMAYNLKSNKIKQLLKGTDGLHPAQSGLGRIVGQRSDTGEVLMPAYGNTGGSSPPRNLYRVNLDRGRGRQYKRGNKDTIDWLVAPDGTVLAREDYSNRGNLYSITSDVGGKEKKIYEMTDAERIPFSLYGVKPGNESLILVNRGLQGGFDQLREMDFEGNISRPILSRDDADIDQVIMDADRVVHGVRYSGNVPSYEFFDEKLNEDLETLVDSVSFTAVELIDWSKDWRYLLLKFEGQMSSGAYIRYDRDTRQSLAIGQARPAIPSEALGEIISIKYPAQDGLKIPAIVTFPPKSDIGKPSKLPLIVMPHGGPETYDAVGFDWMAQYFANRGYLVLQPNFRGSAGHGANFVHAGNGEWGGKMQDDVTDGVKALVNDGFADPDRVCIAGASYGGYSALAGGAFTPDLYKCVVAIAPVSDLNLMMKNEKRDRGKHHWAINYWEERMADGDARKEKLKSISPVNFADNFQAPVLLLHGKDDTVVPMRQSEVMNKALKRAKKDVEFIKLRGEDHWLSTSKTRLATLKAMDEFIEQHIGN